MSHALILGETIRGAARSAGVHPSTVFRWLKDPAFRDALVEARRESFFLAKDTLRLLSESAVVVVGRMLKSKDEAARLRAAALVIDRALKLEEVEQIERRLDELEAIIAAAAPPSKTGAEG